MPSNAPGTARVRACSTSRPPASTAISSGDAQTYRGDGEIDQLRADKDCLNLFREKVVETGLLTDDQLDEIYEEEKQRVADAASAAQAAPRATEADLMTDVYASY